VNGTILDRGRTVALRLMVRLFCVLIAFALASCGGGPEYRPDIVVVLLDTTRADHLGPYSRKDTDLTPFLSSLAEKCVVFDNAWTASTCTAPSTASIVTGLLPPHHGVESNLWIQASANWEGRPKKGDLQHLDMVALPSSIETLPEHMSKAGYQTVCVGSNMNVCEEIGFTRGVDHFSVAQDRDAEVIAEEVKRITKELDPDRPSFYFLHYMDPHAPYGQRRPWCEHTEKSACNPRCRYASEIAYMDAQIEQLFTEMGWPEDTIVVVVSDHGEEFRDHGGIMHRYTVYQELSRSALMMHVPGVEPQRSSVPAHHVDILPTIIEILDLDVPPARDGIALLPALEDETAWKRPVVTYRLQRGSEKQLWGMAFENWRLIEEVPTGKLELYDLSSDPRERHDLSAEMPAVVERGRAELARIRAGLVPIPRENVTVDLTDHLTEELIKLGYAGDGD